MIHRPALILLIATLLLADPIAAATAATITGTARISDGDTITIKGTRIRLNGIDAPETDQVCINKAEKNYTCGIAARDALARLVQGRSVTCTGNDIDRYGRRIMTCFVGETDINAAMVAGGWALAFRRYSDIYVGEEKAARTKQAGLWSGAFIAPWDWRHRGPQTEILGTLSVPIDAQQHLLPQPAASTSPVTGCQIKGNISQDGTRIYHVPGQQDYDKTRISESKGERWFCTEDEAHAAGWRRARN
ncbi:thermonuclease family protein [Daeguia caeni]|uniref:Thermonuclease family protein n=1 Tax=Daeguia caeni TaxID=439612 RepID=A0ABV9H2M8_9HYPH